MSENLRRYQRSMYAFDAVVRRVPEGAFDNQSPCEEWTGREVVGHVIWGAHALASVAGGGALPESTPEAELAGDDPVAAWSAASAAALEAVDQPGALQRIGQSPIGELPIDDMLGFFYADPVMHTWDLAQAAGIEHGLPEDLADDARILWEGAGDMLRRPGALGPVEAAPDGADAATKMAACGGRKVG